MTGIPTERVFSLAAFEGLKLIWFYGAKQPDLDAGALIKLIESVDADGASLDLEASAYLDTIVDNNCPSDGLAFYQSCIKAVLIRHQPLWAKSMRQGRMRFVMSLDRDDQDIFSAAGLMHEMPGEDVVSWWDDVVGHARLLTDIEKMEQARVAERLSIAHEVDRLSQLGIAKVPQWMGLDDNYAGYDILSYDYGKQGVVNRMIEVKSTIASPLRFILTRHEWEQALKVGDAYLFHVWDMNKSPEELFVRSVAEVAPHVPSDNEKGKWSSASIPLG